MSLEIDERRIPIVPSGFIGVEPIDQMVMVGVADLEKIPLISQKSFPYGTISRNSARLFAEDTFVASETNILAYECRLDWNSLSIPLGPRA